MLFFPQLLDFEALVEITIITQTNTELTLNIPKRCSWAHAEWEKLYAYGSIKCNIERTGFPPSESANRRASYRVVG